MTWDPQGFEECFKAAGDYILQLSALRGKYGTEANGPETEILEWLRRQDEDRLRMIAEYLDFMYAGHEALMHFVMKALAEKA